MCIFGKGGTDLMGRQNQAMRGEIEIILVATVRSCVFGTKEEGMDRKSPNHY